MWEIESTNWFVLRLITSTGLFTAWSLNTNKIFYEQEDYLCNVNLLRTIAV